MAKVKIELDISIIEEAIKLKSAPQVAEMLARLYDIPKMIVDELAREPKKKEREEGFSLPFLYGYSVPKSGPEFVQSLIRSAIHEAAEEYVKVAIDERRDAIYTAFRKMMADSPDRLANAFVNMIEGADIEFDLATTLSVRE